tara:strand:+ start:1526 stop:1885 length:360 start_codon:yes stop_codon:yes gene_type:complete
MRAADYISSEMMDDIMEDMRPDNNSIECIKIHSLKGVNSLRQIGGKEIDPYLIAEVVDGNSFSAYNKGAIIMVPQNACHFVPTKGKRISRRFFVRTKHIRGITKKSQWDITDENRWGTE